MPRYLVAIHHPEDYEPFVSEDKEMHLAIDALNDEMVAAGIRIFVGGLHPGREAVSVFAKPDGEVVVEQRPYIQSSEHVGGFWVLEVDDLEQALAWGRKAVVACKAPVEVRLFH